MENEGHARPAPQYRHPLRRPGCILALVIWLMVMLTPCLMLYLAVRGEISLTTGSAPDQRTRIWLIQEARQSGIGFSNASVSRNEDLVCVQTDVRFLLWRGEAVPTQYCECYSGTEENWVLSSLEQTACEAP